jgi:CheY-like chemotaxis protein
VNRTHKAGDLKKRILVVDDEPVLADTLATIFRRAGYDARSVYSCEAALPLIESLQPVFVVADVVMPGMNGITLATKIRTSYPSCGVLLFSGNADTQSLLELSRRVGHDFEILAKPVSPPVMLAKLASLVSLHEAK